MSITQCTHQKSHYLSLVYMCVRHLSIYDIHPTSHKQTNTYVHIVHVLMKTRPILNSYVCIYIELPFSFHLHTVLPRWVLTLYQHHCQTVLGYSFSFDCKELPFQLPSTHSSACVCHFNTCVHANTHTHAHTHTRTHARTHTHTPSPSHADSNSRSTEGA